MTRHFFRLRFPLTCALSPPLCHIKTRTLAGRERSLDLQVQNGKLEFGRHVAVSWQVAIDFETDADFNQNGRRPSHDVLLFDLRENDRAKNMAPQVAALRNLSMLIRPATIPSRARQCQTVSHLPLCRAACLMTPIIGARG